MIKRKKKVHLKLSLAQKRQNNSKDVGVILSLLSMFVAFFLLSQATFNKNKVQLRTTMIDQVNLETTLSEDDNRERLPGQLDDSSSSSVDTTSISDSDADSSLDTNSSIDNSQSDLSSPVTNQNDQVEPDSYSMPPNQTNPGSGISENLIIAFAIILGVFGSVMFIVSKRAT